MLREQAYQGCGALVIGRNRAASPCRCGIWQLAAACQPCLCSSSLLLTLAAFATCSPHTCRCCIAFPGALAASSSTWPPTTTEMATAAAVDGCCSRHLHATCPCCCTGRQVQWPPVLAFVADICCLCTRLRMAALASRCIGYQFFDLATNHLGRRSFFTTTDEEQWLLIRKGTAQAFSQANIRWAQNRLQP